MASAAPGPAGHQLGRGPLVQLIRVTVESVMVVAFDLAAPPQKIAEATQVGRQLPRIDSAQTDVQEFAFAKTPPVALQVRAKKQLGHLRLHRGG
jgi:hypothetical protein